MVSPHSFLIVLSSAALRICSFIFLRWIPGHHFVPAIISSLAIYLGAISVQTRAPKDSTSRKEKDKSHDGDKTKREKPPSSTSSLWDGIMALFTGLPSPRSKSCSYATIGLNLIVAALSLDLLLRSQILHSRNDLRLARVGYISPTTAKILVREPDPAQLPLEIYYREREDTDSGTRIWTTAGTIYKLTEDVDFTHSLDLNNLRPSTHYEYSLSNNQSGFFNTAAAPGTPQADALTFLTSSCIKPNFPYNPFSHSLAIHGFNHLSNVITSLISKSLVPSFMLFLGDFIYIDVPHRFGSSASHYRSEYRRVYSSPSWNSPLPNPAGSIPWLHILDDHEIENDWAAGNTTSPYPAAADPYSLYHVGVNPPIPNNAHSPVKNTTYFTFTEGPASFFLVDTRTYRSAPNSPNSTILGSAQLSSLLEYIKTPPSPQDGTIKWRIIASSVPFTKNWRVGTSDTWGGFLSERRTVFEAMWAAERAFGIRFILLSGDRHEFGATRFPEPGTSEIDLANGSGIHEFSVGPLSMFYLPVRSFRYVDNEDIPVKYVPDGNSKFGAITVRNRQARPSPRHHEGESDDDLEWADNRRTNALVPDVAINADTAAGTATKRNKDTAIHELIYTLYVDGKNVWEYELTAPAGCEETGSVENHKEIRCARNATQRTVLDSTGREGTGVYDGMLAYIS